MLHHCDLCPQQTVVCNFLKEQLLLNYMIDDLIKYKNGLALIEAIWKSMRMTSMIFLINLLQFFFEMTEHDFIAKKQSEFLRVKKASLKFDEAVLILYLFIYCSRLCPKLSLEQCSGSNPSLCFILFES